jgi:MADS-box transcription factor
LKRKGGLFKKAYELSVLCDVDVAVVILGKNKKLHQFSSRDMREMLHRWTLVCALLPVPAGHAANVTIR